MIPKMLLTRMNANSVVRYGTYLRNSGPIMSRAMLLRTRPWNASPRNCPLPGTSCGLRTASRNSTRMTTVASTSSQDRLRETRDARDRRQVEVRDAGGLESRRRTSRGGGQGGHEASSLTLVGLVPGGTVLNGELASSPTSAPSGPVVGPWPGRQDRDDQDLTYLT